MKEEPTQQALIQRIGELEAALDRGRSERAGLQRMAERYALALDATGEGVWDWNLATDEVWLSRRSYTMLGYSPEEFPPAYESWVGLLHPEDRDIAVRAFREYIKLKRKHYDAEFRMKTKEGQWRWILGRGRIVAKDASGSPLRMVGTYVDITAQKQAGEAHGQIAKSYQTLAENLPGIVYRVFLREQGRMQFFNDMLEKMTGFSPQELHAGQVCHIDPLIVSEDHERVFKTVQEAIEQHRPFEIEYRMITRDKGRRHVLERGQPIYGDNGQPLYIDGVILDITERKLMERALIESENTLEAILSASPVGIALIEKRTIRWTNGTMTRILGYHEDELLGKNTRVLYLDSAEYQRVGRLAYDRLDGSRTEVVDTKMVRKDGRPFDGQIVIRHVDPEDSSKGEIFTLTDITERKAAEMALKESESRFRSLAENSLVGICIVQNGRLVYQNNERLNLFCRHSGSNLPFAMDRIHPNDTEKFAELYKSLVSEKILRAELEIRLLPPRGQTRDVETTWAHILASRIRFGEETAVLFNVMDISHAKQLEQIVRIKDKMSSLGRISAGIAHEIRNPLGGINMYLGVLKMIVEPLEGTDNALRASAMAVIGKIQGASNRIEEVIRRVMDFAKPTVPQLIPVNLNDAVDNALALASVSLHKHGIAVRRRLAADLPCCHADQAMMEQVLLNIINNSVQAMESTKKERRLELVSARVQGGVAIHLSDSGPGVAKNLRERIFDPFVTTRSDGSGIGLSISHRIVADHHGTLSVSDSPWGGATFSIRIPLEKRMAPR
ncbi:MAG: PAS domain S-box protein [Desulfobacterales bacterium]|nr:PAS domain S-box protein [Desulfobacterales bacterium]